MTTQSSELYPILDHGMSFRLNEIANIRDRLQSEVQTRDRTRRRYQAAYTTSHAINTCVCIAGSATSATAVGSLATGVGVMIALPLGAVSLAAGVASIVGSGILKVLHKKIEKHDKLLTLAESKLATVNTLVSKSLKDNSISDSEFELIQNEMSDYHTKKRAIQTKVRTQVGSDLDGLKKELLEEGRKQGLMEARQALNEKS